MQSVLQGLGLGPRIRYFLPNFEVFQYIQPCWVDLQLYNSFNWVQKTNRYLSGIFLAQFWLFYDFFCQVLRYFSVSLTILTVKQAGRWLYNSCTTCTQVQVAILYLYLGTFGPVLVVLWLFWPTFKVFQRRIRFLAVFRAADPLRANLSISKSQYPGRSSHTINSISFALPCET